MPRPLMVSDMTNDADGWDWERIQGLLPQHLIEHILAEVPPSCNAGTDILGWRLEDRRIFTTKSAYGRIYLLHRECYQVSTLMEWSSRFAIIAGCYGRTVAVVYWGQSICVERSCWRVGIVCLTSA
ncbi:hypothetical protein V6N11_023783 [Hibiscus sabdariffa]|uniref:Uncharacterized protein n=1 Tax=Hibiscus sabdariffa TaxID=183260 RepID=A0ABR2TNL8_9ROSI